MNLNKKENVNSNRKSYLNIKYIETIHAFKYERINKIYFHRTILHFLNFL